MNGKRRGFTLVELLIVIVVIGILSAMMMFSSTEAVSSAKASNIVSNLNIMKKAVIAWYTDNYHRVKEEAWSGKKTAYKVDGYFLGEFVKDKGGEKEFQRYFSSGKSVKITKDNYTKEGDFFLATEGADWYVGYDVGSNMSVREKLAGRAKTSGLLGGTKKKDKNGKDIADTETIELYDAAKHSKVYMLILSFN